MFGKPKINKMHCRYYKLQKKDAFITEDLILKKHGTKITMYMYCSTGWLPVPNYSWVERGNASVKYLALKEHTTQ